MHKVVVVIVTILHLHEVVVVVIVTILHRHKVVVVIVTILHLQ